MSIDYDRQSQLNMVRFFYYELKGILKGCKVEPNTLKVFRKLGFVTFQHSGDSKYLLTSHCISLMREVEPT